MELPAHRAQPTAQFKLAPINVEMAFVNQAKNVSSL